LTERGTESVHGDRKQFLKRYLKRLLKSGYLSASTNKLKATKTGQWQVAKASGSVKIRQPGFFCRRGVSEGATECMLLHCVADRYYE